MNYPEYTEIFIKTIEQELGNRFKYLGYCDKLKEMIRIFKSPKCPIAKRSELEEKIATALWENDSYTEYKKHFEDKGKLRCSSYENLRNQNKVNEAAVIYLEYASKFPSNSEMDKNFIDGLYEIYSSFKSSEDYMTRLVHRRLRDLDSFTIKDSDTTRLLILKQFLKELNFFENSPYYSKAFQDYILSQQGVFIGENSYDFTALTDDVFSVLSVKSDLLLREKEKLINYLRYYGGVLPCLEGLYVNLKKVFNNSVLNSFDERVITVSDAFNIDIFKLSVDDMKNDCTQTEFNEIESLFKMCKSEGKKNFSLLINKFPAEYKIATMCKLYSDIKPDAETINLIADVIPAEYLKNNFRNAEKLADIVFCDDLAKVTHKELEDKFADKDKLFELISALEKFAYDLDYDLPIRKSESKLSSDVKSAVAMIFEQIGKEKKISGKIRKGILSLVENKFLSMNQDSMSFLNILEIIKGVFVNYGDKQSLFEDVNIDEIIKSIFSDVNKTLYVDRIYSRADARYSNVRKSSNSKTYDGEVDAKVLKLLSMIDDFAVCRFDEQRTTRELIYVFAIAFKMTVYTGAENEIFDKFTDVQKNLFYDIYADNFVNRYKKDSFIELDGYGVNFKNYAELCFIYAIRNRGKMLSSEVLEKAYTLIEECRKNGKTKEELEESKKILSTQLTDKYKEEFVKFYLNGSEEDFVEFVINNCVCISNTTKTKNSSDNRTAQCLYKSLYKEVTELERRVLEEVIDIEVTEYLDDSINFYNEWEKLYMNTVRCANCEYRSEYRDFKSCIGYLGDNNKNCVSMFNDYLEKGPDKAKAKEDIEYNLRKKLKEELIKPLWDIKEVYKDIEDESFLELLEQLQKEFKDSVTVASSGNFLIDNVTRTKFIALYYYYLILKLQDPESDDLEYDESNSEKKYEPVAFYDDELFDNFNDFYKYVRDDSLSITVEEKEYTGLNKCLEACGYQPINAKNIYDVFVLFFVFRNYFNKFHNLDKQDII